MRRTSLFATALLLGGCQVHFHDSNAPLLVPPSEVGDPGTSEPWSRVDANVHVKGLLVVRSGLAKVLSEGAIQDAFVRSYPIKPSSLERAPSGIVVRRTTAAVLAFRLSVPTHEGDCGWTEAVVVEEAMPNGSRMAFGPPVVKVFASYETEGLPLASAPCASLGVQ